MILCALEMFSHAGAYDYDDDNLECLVLLTCYVVVNLLLTCYAVTSRH